MNPALREQLRLKIVAIAATAGELGMREEAIEVHLTTVGLECASAETKAELRYLEDKGLIKPLPKLISPENKRWRVTAEGRDFLAEQGLG